MKVKYVAISGSRLKNSDANLFGNIIANKLDNKPDPKAQVDYARPKKSPAHRYFEWDDTIAGEMYRIDQARHIIRSIAVIAIPGKRPVRSFVFVPVVKSYMATDCARESKELWESVVHQALDEVVNWRERYKMYKELSPIVVAITKVEGRLNHGKTKESKRNRKGTKGRSSTNRSGNSSHYSDRRLAASSK